MLQNMSTKMMLLQHMCTAVRYAVLTRINEPRTQVLGSSGRKNNCFSSLIRKCALESLKKEVAFPHQPLKSEVNA